VRSAAFSGRRIWTRRTKGFWRWGTLDWGRGREGPALCGEESVVIADLGTANKTGAETGALARGGGALGVARIRAGGTGEGRPRISGPRQKRAAKERKEGPRKGGGVVGLTPTKDDCVGRVTLFDGVR
jgi:hypothetical protein